MEEKQNDMLGIVTGTPDVNMSDLIESGVTLDNTTLKSKDYYKALPKVQQTFTDETGKFNTKVFDVVYDKAASLVKELGDDDYIKNTIAYDPYDMTAPIGSKKQELQAEISKDINPTKELYSRTGLNSITENTQTPEELAQQHKIWDSKEEKWIDQSANDWGIKSLFKQTLVYAKWDEDGENINPVTKVKERHRKGDWKIDENGDFYTETLNNRDVYNKQIVNPADILTTDGSVFNKFDPFDSDGRTKSVFKTTARLALEMAPFFIPGVNTVYGGVKMALGLASALPIFYKAGEGIISGDTNSGNESDLWKAMNAAQGFMSKYTDRNISYEGKQSMFGYEQLTGMISDLFSQIYEQRAAASLAQVVYKVNTPAYAKKLEDLAGAELIKGALSGEVTSETVAQRAMAKVADIESKRSNLAKKLSLGYMALTQSSNIYNDALNGGYDERTAGFAALLAASGQYGLMMNNRMGTWFLDKTTGYTEDLSKGAIRKTIRDQFDNIKNGMNLASVDKQAGRKVLGNIFKTVKDAVTEMPMTGESIWKNAIVEGVEEGTEQLAIDMSKGLIDTLSYLGLTQSQGSFGGWSTVFSKEGLYNYVQNILGGMVGGSLFEFQRSVLDPKLRKVTVSPETENDLIRLVANGNKAEIFKAIDKEKNKYASSELAPTQTADGYTITKDNNISQADMLANILKQQVENYDRILNTNNLVRTDEDLVRKAVRDEITIQNMKANHTDSFVISDMQELTKDIINLTKKIESFKENPPENLTQELTEKQLKVSKILKGDYAEDYHQLSLFTLNKNLYSPFAAMTVEDLAKIKYNKNINELDSETVDNLTKEFKDSMEDGSGFKAMRLKFEAFKSLNAQLSPSIKEYEASGYADLRKKFYSELRGNKTSLIDLYKSYKDLQVATFQRTQFLKDKKVAEAIGFTPRIDLNTDIDLSLGNYLVNVANAVKTTPENKETLIKEIDNLAIQNNVVSGDQLQKLFDLVNQSHDSKIAELSEKLLTDPENTELKEEIRYLEDTKLNMTTKEDMTPWLNTLISYSNSQDELDSELVDDLVKERKGLFDLMDANKEAALYQTNLGEDLQNEFMQSPETWEHKNILGWLGGITRETAEEVYNKATNEEKNVLNKLFSEFNYNLLNNIDKLTKILENKPRKINSLYEKLKNFQFTIYGDTVSIFDVLQNNIDQFNRIVSPTEFTTSDKQLALINKAIATLDTVGAISNAMLTTEISPTNLYGYNVLLQQSSDKLGLNRKYEFINQQSYNTIVNDLNLVRNKLQFFKQLAESNASTELEIQEKIKDTTVNLLIGSLTDANNGTSAINIKVNDSPLLTMSDIPSDQNMSSEQKLVEIGQKIYENFQTLSKDNFDDAVDQVISAFKADANFQTLIDVGRNTNLTPDLKLLEFRDRYIYLATLLGAPSKDFYFDYKKVIEKELTLQENKKAPFYSQQLVLQETYSYLKNPGLFSKFILAVQGKVTDFSTEFPSVPIPNILFIKGGAGTGKTSVISNFALRMIEGNSKLVGNNVSVTLTAPTEKTLKGLEVNATRTLTSPFTSLIKNDLLKSLFVDPNEYSEFVNDWEKIKEAYEKGEKLPDSIYYTIRNLSSNEVLVKNIKLKQNSNPQIIFIDEFGKFNPMELQVLSMYMDANPNTRIIGTGDEFQDGEVISDSKGNKFSYSLENVLAIPTIKLKSSIRANSTLKADNNAILERWVEDSKLASYTTGSGIIVTKPILTYYEDGNSIYGDKFTSNYDDLRKLNPEKEIVFITPDGKLTDEQKELVKKITDNPIVLSEDQQGQEFDQVVILSKFEQYPKLAGKKHIYTLLSRAKDVTLIFNNNELIGPVIDQVESKINSEKVLQENIANKAIQDEITNLTNILGDYQISSNAIINKPVDDIDPFTKAGQEKTDDELTQEPEKSVVKHDDYKFICYSFYNNLGTTENLWDPNWSYNYKGKTINLDTEIDNLEDLFNELSGEYKAETDLFGLKIPSMYFNDKHTLRDLISDYVRFKNSLLFNGVDGTGIIDVFNLGVEHLYPNLKVIGLEKYSQPFGKIANNNFVSGKKYFAGYEINGTFITTLALPDISNSTLESYIAKDKLDHYKKFLDEIDKDPNGRIINEAVFYNKLKKYTNLVIPKPSSDAKNKRLPDGIPLDEFRKMFPGAKISEAKVFYNDAPESGDTRKQNIKATLEKYGSVFSADFNYGNLAFRPYVTVSFQEGNKNYTKLILLTGNSRNIKTLFEEINNPVGETKEEINDYLSCLVSKYDGWKLLSDYFVYLRQTSDLDVDSLKLFGETTSEFDDLVRKLIAQEEYEHYGTNDAGLHFEVLKEILEKVQLNRDGKYTGFSEIVRNNPTLKNYITGKATDAFGERLTNPVFLLNAIPNLPKWDQFLNDYKEEYYYNTKITKLDNLEGFLPKSLEKNYKAYYAVETPKYFLDLENYEDLFEEKKETEEEIPENETFDTWFSETLVTPKMDISLGEKNPFVVKADVINSLYKDVMSYGDISGQFKSAISNYIKRVYNLVESSKKSRSGGLIYNGMPVNPEVLLSNITTEKSVTYDKIFYGPAITVDLVDGKAVNIRIYNSDLDEISETEDIHCKLI